MTIASILAALDKIPTISRLEPYVPHDKQLHVLAGFVITLALGVVTGSFAIAFGAAVFAGGAKEAYDAYANRVAARAGEPLPHDVELGDAVATVAGGTIAVLALELFSVL